MATRSGGVRGPVGRKGFEEGQSARQHGGPRAARVNLKRTHGP